MKKLIFLFLLSCIMISCGSLDQFIELSVDNELTESIDAHVPQTLGAVASFNLTETADLNSGDLAKYLDKISALKINTLSYKFIEFSGNSAGTITSGTLKFDNTVVATLTNFNISNASTARTVFNITDSAFLTQIEATLLNNKSTTILLKGSALSDAGSMDFKIEVSMNMTVTINE
jgi:hypothetical protein